MFISQSKSICQRAAKQGHGKNLKWQKQQVVKTTSGKVSKQVSLRQMFLQSAWDYMWNNNLITIM
jgi:hypothetical protein